MIKQGDALRLIDPIPDAVDTKQIRENIQELGLVPYLGRNQQTAHVILTLIHNLLRKSMTYRSVMKMLKTYSFGHGLMMVERQSEGLLLEDTEQLTPRTDSREIAAYIKGLGLSVTKILHQSGQLFENYQASGNMYLLIRMINTLNVWSIETQVIPYRHIGYKKPSGSGPWQFLISKSWEKKYTDENKPKRVFASSVEDEQFNWTDRGNGIFETVLHCKNDLGEGDFYGESEMLAAIERLFVEQTEDSTACKISAEELVSKIMLLLEKPDSAAATEPGQELDDEDTFKEVVYALKQVATAKGSHKKSSSMAVVEYPNGTNQPKAIKLGVNRDTAYSKHQIETSERKIAGILAFPLELTYQRQAKTTLGGNLMSDLFNIANVSTIEPIQIKFESFWGRVLKEVFDLTGRSQYEDVGIKYPDMISKLVDKLSAGSTAKEAAVEAENTNENE